MPTNLKIRNFINKSDFKKNERKSARDIQTINASDSAFFDMFKKALEYNFINKGGSIEKKWQAIDDYQTMTGYMTRSSKSMILTNSAGTQTKLLASMVPDSQAPRYQKMKSAKNQVTIKPLTATVLELCRLKGIKHPHVNLITFAGPNCSKGQLKSTENKLWDVVKKINRRNSHHKHGQIGLNLPSLNGGVVLWLGDLAVMECTVNQDAIDAQQIYNLYHPHIHMVVITDGPLDLKNMVELKHPNMLGYKATMPAAKAKLFEFILDNLHIGELSPEAFSIEDATANAFNRIAKSKHVDYENLGADDVDDDEEDDEEDDTSYVDDDDDQSVFMDALVETDKYATKPDTYGRLARAFYNGLKAHPNSKELPDESLFAIEVFAEIHDAHYGVTFRRNHGFILQARGFLNWCEKVGLGSAVTSAYYADQNPRNTIPTFLTHRAEVGMAKDTKINVKTGQSRQSKRLGFINKHQLTPQQLVYFNAMILAHSGFDSAKLYQVKFGDSKKSKLYELLLKRMVFADSGKSGLIARLDRWIEVEKKNCSTNSFIKNSPKLRDLKAVLSAVDSEVCDSGYFYSAKWSLVPKYIQMIEVLVKAGYSPRQSYNDKGSEPSTIESQALRYFGDHAFGDPDSDYKTFDMPARFNGGGIDQVVDLVQKYNINHTMLSNILWGNFSEIGTFRDYLICAVSDGTTEYPLSKIVNGCKLEFTEIGAVVGLIQGYTFGGKATSSYFDGNEPGFYDCVSYANYTDSICNDVDTLQQAVDTL